MGGALRFSPFMRFFPLDTDIQPCCYLTIHFASHLVLLMNLLFIATLPIVVAAAAAILVVA